MSTPTVAFKALGGRASSSGIIATVFGAGGFLGKYVVPRLGQTGSRVICPYRGDELNVRPLKLGGGLGYINLYPMSIRNIDEIKKAIDGSNVVINLLSKNYETRFSFPDVNISFPSVVAEICAEKKVDRLVHFSALGASLESTSAFARTKAIGEIAVREAFPGATIMRPATIFGDEDRFLNRMVKMSQKFPHLPVVAPTTTMEQPVFVDDVAKAVREVVLNPETAGQAYDLGGPSVYSVRELYEFLFKSIHEPDNIFEVPAAVGQAIATGISYLPNPWVTPDMLKYQLENQILKRGNGLTELGIIPTAMEDRAQRYLIRFKKTSQFVDTDENSIIRQQQ